MQQDNSQDLYRIGTVASLTGIAVERLRAWERRYGLEPAHKSGRTRFYDHTQLQQLGLIKRLVDQGQPISSLANLTIEQLQQRLLGTAQAATVVPVIAPQVALIGPNLMVLEQQQSVPGRIDVVARWANLESFNQDRSGISQIDIIFAQLPVLSLQTIDFIADIYPSAKVIALYQFATEDAVSSFAEASVAAVKWPVTWSELEHMAVVERGLESSAPGITARQYSDEELIAMAVSDHDPSQRVPQLIELLQQTNAFISYAQACEQQGIATSTRLAEHISTARSQLEYALEHLHRAQDDASMSVEKASTTQPVQNINKF